MIEILYFFFFSKIKILIRRVYVLKNTLATLSNIKKGIDRGRKISRRIATSFATLRE